MMFFVCPGLFAGNFLFIGRDSVVFTLSAAIKKAACYIHSAGLTTALGNTGVEFQAGLLLLDCFGHDVGVVAFDAQV